MMAIIHPPQSPAQNTLFFSKLCPRQRGLTVRSRRASVTSHRRQTARFNFQTDLPEGYVDRDMPRTCPPRTSLPSLCLLPGPFKVEGITLSRSLSLLGRFAFVHSALCLLSEPWDHLGRWMDVGLTSPWESFSVFEFSMVMILALHNTYKSAGTFGILFTVTGWTHESKCAAPFLFQTLFIIQEGPSNHKGI